MADTTTLLALALLGSLTLYALLGGADYGGGLWDLLAGGPTADRQRATIAHAIGPVWEANHVWLIAAVVIVFSGFPPAFAALSTFLHVPLVLVLAGIVLRGSAFVFRAYGREGPRRERLWGRVFAIASMTTPVFLGVIVGGITEGRLPARAGGPFAEVFVRPWLTPFALGVGVLALALFAYLASVYLTLEASDREERAAFRMRALISGGVAGVLAAAVLGLAPPELRGGLLGAPWAAPLFGSAGISAAAAMVLLWRERFAAARVAAACQVVLILWGWALAQYPFALRPHLTLAEAAAPPAVRAALLQVLAAGAIVLLPALLFLFRIFGPRGRGRAEALMAAPMPSGSRLAPGEADRERGR